MSIPFHSFAPSRSLCIIGRRREVESGESLGNGRNEFEIEVSRTGRVANVGLKLRMMGR